MARISPGTMTAAIFAILVGLAGAYMVRQYLSQPQVVASTPEQPPAETIYVPVAAADFDSGHQITLNDIVVLKFSRQQYRESEFASQRFMTDTAQIMGRTLKEPMGKNEVFAPTIFYPDGMGPGIAELLRPGYRAVTVPIADVGAVQGFARPGSVVDVLFRSEATGERPEITLTLLEVVEVLALNRTIQPGRDVSVSDSDRNRGTVTLAVSPRQAKALKAVEGRGELTLTLRSPDDRATSVDEEIAGMTPISMKTEKELRGLGQSERVTLDDLLGINSRNKPFKMEVYRGASKEVVEFEQRNPVPSLYDGPVPGFISTPIIAEEPRESRNADPALSQNHRARPVVIEASRTTDGS